MFGRCVVNKGLKQASSHKVVFQIPDFSKPPASIELGLKKQRKAPPPRRTNRTVPKSKPVETGPLHRHTQRVMLARSVGTSGVQVGVLEDGALVEHYISHGVSSSLVGNIYMGKVQNVLSGMEAAFVDIGHGRNAVLYSGEAIWEGVKVRDLEGTIKEGDSVLVQVTKDPVSGKGARVTTQISLAGRYLVYSPNSGGVSRRIDSCERTRLQKALKSVVDDVSSLIIRTAAVGATAEQLGNDATTLVERYRAIQKQSESAVAPTMIYSEPDLLIRLLRDVFNNDFKELVVEGSDLYERVNGYLQGTSPEMLDIVRAYSEGDLFASYKITEQIDRSLNRKVLLPSGGSLVVDHTEAMTVIDVNTGKFTGTGGNLEQTVTENNLEAVDEIVRQIRLRDLGGIVVIDFIDMLLQENRDLVYNRLLDALSLDRSRHKVAEITSLGLVQMTRKKLGLAAEPAGELCNKCSGRGRIVNTKTVKSRKKHKLRQLNQEASAAAVKIISAIHHAATSESTPSAPDEGVTHPDLVTSGNLSAVTSGNLAGVSRCMDSEAKKLSAGHNLDKTSALSDSAPKRRRRLVTSTIDSADAAQELR